MSNTSDLPLNLYKANLELQARVTRLARQNGQQWLEWGNRLLDDGIADSDATVSDLLKAENWQALATLPADAFWRQLQQRFGDGQAAAQLAVGTQTAFVQGLQEAVQAWQRETAEAIGTNPLAIAPGSAWGELFKPFKPFEQFLQPAKPATASKGAKGAANGK